MGEHAESERVILSREWDWVNKDGESETVILRSKMEWVNVGRMRD